jgi:hypothetical protein
MKEIGYCLDPALNHNQPWPQKSKLHSPLITQAYLLVPSDFGAEIQHGKRKDPDD